jgi:hypothetical protein
MLIDIEVWIHRSAGRRETENPVKFSFVVNAIHFRSYKAFIPSMKSDSIIYSEIPLYDIRLVSAYFHLISSRN